MENELNDDGQKQCNEEVCEPEREQTNTKEEGKNGENREENGRDDEGEIPSGDEAESSQKIASSKGRKRHRESEKKMEGEEKQDEPKSKKAMLESLRNMRFATKDPFKENP